MSGNPCALNSSFTFSLTTPVCKAEPPKKAPTKPPKVVPTKGTTLPIAAPVAAPPIILAVLGIVSAIIC